MAIQFDSLLGRRADGRPESVRVLIEYPVRGSAISMGIEGIAKNYSLTNQLTSISKPKFE